MLVGSPISGVFTWSHTINQQRRFRITASIPDGLNDFFDFLRMGVSSNE
jgi:hypothetical protein